MEPHYRSSQALVLGRRITAVLHPQGGQIATRDTKQEEKYHNKPVRFEDRLVRELREEVQSDKNKSAHTGRQELLFWDNI